MKIGVFEFILRGIQEKMPFSIENEIKYLRLGD
jgi:hypothetical protein